MLMLLPVSLHSHAAVSNDIALSIFSDWVHLAMTSLWVGGLAQLLVAIPVVAMLPRPIAPKLGSLAVHFSNYARAAVVGLVVTGLYATWHQVNTLEALTTTFYGQLLSIKLVLALLLLAIATINLVWTQRRLLAGQGVWVGRLRTLVSLEVLLALAVLLVVGGMTAVNPARNEMVQREARQAAAAIPPPPQPQPIHVMEMVDDLHIMMDASPGWVGTNTFTVHLMDEDGIPITNATLLRMRFEHQSENLGESELQIRPETEVADGIYTIEGANLSTVGEWRLRMTIQRPDEYDSVADFNIAVIVPPVPAPPPPIVESDPVPPYRTPVLLVVGGTALVAGLYLLAKQQFRLWQGAGLLASLLLILGVTFVLTGFLT
jgi:copper transport protein